MILIMRYFGYLDFGLLASDLWIQNDMDSHMFQMLVKLSRRSSKSSSWLRILITCLGNLTMYELFLLCCLDNYVFVGQFGFARIIFESGLRILLIVSGNLTVHVILKIDEHILCDMNYLFNEDFNVETFPEFLIVVGAFSLDFSVGTFTGI